MSFTSIQFDRKGEINIRARVVDVFPLLCPKREEEWIPGWECETIWSHSGYNEEGAIFRTAKAYGTELYWNTIEYDILGGVVDFLITAPYLYIFRFKIHVASANDGLLTLSFSQTFTSVSEEGNDLLNQYEKEDFAGRLRNLGEFMNQYLLDQPRNEKQ